MQQQQLIVADVAPGAVISTAGTGAMVEVVVVVVIVVVVVVVVKVVVVETV